MRPVEQTLTTQASGYPERRQSGRKTMSPRPFWAHLLRQRRELERSGDSRKESKPWSLWPGVVVLLRELRIGES